MPRVGQITRIFLHVSLKFVCVNREFLRVSPTVLESVPEVSAKLEEANTKEIKFGDVAERAKQAAVVVLVH